MNNLKLIVLSNFSEVGKKVDKHLQSLYGTKESFIVPIEEVRFSNGEGKVVINDTIREKDVFILCDVGNYSCTYKMYGFENHKSADDHFQDLKRVIYAIIIFFVVALVQFVFGQLAKADSTGGNTNKNDTAACISCFISSADSCAR